MAAEAAPNPLASTKRGVVQPHPELLHAQVWKGVNQMPSDDLASKAAIVNYATPLLGALAGNPKTTPKDVIKAAANAAADGKIKPSEAVEFISSMPADPTKLQAWLKQHYEEHLSAGVHMEAAMMRRSAQPTLPGAPQAQSLAAPAANPLASTTPVQPGASA